MFMIRREKLTDRVDDTLSWDNSQVTEKITNNLIFTQEISTHDLEFIFTRKPTQILGNVFVNNNYKYFSNYVFK